MRFGGTQRFDALFSYVCTEPRVGGRACSSALFVYKICDCHGVHLSIDVQLPHILRYVMQRPTNPKQRFPKCRNGYMEDCIYFSSVQVTQSKSSQWWFHNLLTMFALYFIFTPLPPHGAISAGHAFIDPPYAYQLDTDSICEQYAWKGGYLSVSLF